MSRGRNGNQLVYLFNHYQAFETLPGINELIYTFQTAIEHIGLVRAAVYYSAAGYYVLLVGDSGR